MEMQAASGGAPVTLLVQVLRQAMEMQTDLAEKLIATEVETQVESERLEIAGQIVDVYA